MSIHLMNDPYILVIYRLHILNNKITGDGILTNITRYEISNES
jgi:hypothetical protein